MMKEELQKYVQLLIEKEKTKQSRKLLSLGFMAVIICFLITIMMIICYDKFGTIWQAVLMIAPTLFFAYLFLDATIENKVEKLEEEEKQYHPIKGKKGMIKNITKKLFS